MDPRGTCSRCGVAIFGGGDIGTKTEAGRYVCTVCFLDVDAMRDFVEQSGLFDMQMIDKLIQEVKPTYDEFRGRELRRRAKLADENEEVCPGDAGGCMGDCPVCQRRNAQFPVKSDDLPF
jgi:hypothetical protein